MLHDILAIRAVARRLQRLAVVLLLGILAASCTACRGKRGEDAAQGDAGTPRRGGASPLVGNEPGPSERFEGLLTETERAELETLVQMAQLAQILVMAAQGVPDR